MRKFLVPAVMLAAAACADAPSAPGLRPPTTAAATVTLDPATGTGWVGKGDVQTAYGWANKAMQQNHTAITFEYDNTTTYTWVCEWTTGVKNPTYHSQDRTVTRGVQGVIGNIDRKTGQWTGWFLTGYTSMTGGEGDFTPSCPGNDAGDGGSGEKVVQEGSLVATPNGGGLYANHPSFGRRAIPITPVL